MAADTTTTVCAECREMQTNRPWLLRALGHRDCLDVILAERRAARMFWIRIDPQGHVEGSALGGLASGVEGAHKRFTPRVRDRSRETAEGYRHELVNGDEWDRRARPCLGGECEHVRAGS